MITYIILENFTSQIFVYFLCKQVIPFHSCTMGLEAENIKYKEEGEIFLKNILRKKQVSSPRLFYNPAIKRNFIRIDFNHIKREHKKIFIMH